MIVSTVAGVSSGRLGTHWAIHVLCGGSESRAAFEPIAWSDSQNLPERRIPTLGHENVADRTVARPIQPMSVGKPIPVKDD
jgi:hypothetical protein